MTLLPEKPLDGSRRKCWRVLLAHSCSAGGVWRGQSQGTFEECEHSHLVLLRMLQSWVTLSSAHQAAVAGMWGAQSGFSWLFMYLLYFVLCGCVLVCGAAYVCTGMCVWPEVTGQPLKLLLRHCLPCFLVFLYDCL